MMAHEIRPGMILDADIDTDEGTVTIGATVGSVETWHGETKIVAFTDGDNREMVTWVLSADLPM